MGGPAYLYFGSAEAAAAAADALSVLFYDDVTIHVKDVTPKKAAPEAGPRASPPRTPAFDAAAPTSVGGSPAQPRSPAHHASVAETAQRPPVNMDAALAMAAQVAADAQATAAARVAAASSGALHTASSAQAAASPAQPTAVITTTYGNDIVPKNVPGL